MLPNPFENHIPPRNPKREAFGIFGGVVIIFLFLWGGANAEELWGRIACIVFAVLMGLCTLFLAYNTKFYKIPYYINSSGVFVRRVGLVPWASIRQVNMTKTHGHHFNPDIFTAYLLLRDVDFLKESPVSPRAAKRIRRKMKVAFSLAGEMDWYTLYEWAERYGEDLNDCCVKVRGVFCLFNSEEYIPPQRFSRWNDKKREEAQQALLQEAQARNREKMQRKGRPPKS